MPRQCLLFVFIQPHEVNRLHVFGEDATTVLTRLDGGVREEDGFNRTYLHHDNHSSYIHPQAGPSECVRQQTP